MARFWPVGFRFPSEFSPERLRISGLHGRSPLSDEVRNARIQSCHQRVFHGDDPPHHPLHRAGVGWVPQRGPGQPEGPCRREHHQWFPQLVPVARHRVISVWHRWHLAGVLRRRRELFFDRCGQRFRDVFFTGPGRGDHPTEGERWRLSRPIGRFAFREDPAHRPR